MSPDHPSIQAGTNPEGIVPIKVFGIETGVWICVFVAFLLLRLQAGIALTLGQDSFQYLSAAQNALDGHFGYTSLVHFDAERSFGVIPAPMVTFPPGYPFAIALVSLSGLSLSSAGLLISLISMTTCVPLLAWVSNGLGLSRVVGNAAIAGFVTNAAVIAVASNVGSDALFTALTLLGIGLLLLARRNAGKGSTWGWVAAGVAFALAYVVRYAALFFIVGLALVVARHLFLSNRVLAKRHAIALTVAGVAALGGIARNVVLVGNWRGGNEKVVSNPISSVLMETVRGANRLLLGPGSGTSGGTVVQRAMLVALFALGMAWLARAYFRRAVAARPVKARVVPLDVGIDMLLLAVAYMACLFYAGLKSVIAYGDSRYFVPLLPLLLLLLGLALQRMLTSVPDGTHRIPLLALVTSLSLYVYLNLLIFQAPRQSGWVPIAAALDAKSTDGRSVRAVVHEATGTNGVVMANNGQTIGHLLARRTVSLVGTHFSTIEWNEDSLRETARRFKVKAIVVYAPTTSEEWDGGSVVPSAFVKKLAQGDAPTWLHLEYRSGNLLVYVPQFEGQ